MRGPLAPGHQLAIELKVPDAHATLALQRHTETLAYVLGVDTVDEWRRCGERPQKRLNRSSALPSSMKSRLPIAEVGSMLNYVHILWQAAFIMEAPSF